MKTHTKIILICLVILDVLAWSAMLSNSFGNRLEFFFFNVGQGDSEMIVMPGNVKLLIDGGPDNGKATGQLDNIMPFNDRYIDLAMISHAELDHFGGLLDIVERYQIGAFIYNGSDSDSERFKELVKLIKERNIPVVVMDEGGSIRYASSTVSILSSHGKNKNEGALVAKFTGGGATALFTGDIGKETELALLREKNIKADILKIPHHGSKYSSTEAFLKAVHPKIAVIEVGKNAYGHPTKIVLDRINKVGASLFRTDRDGMVRLVVENGTIKEYRSTISKNKMAW